MIDGKINFNAYIAKVDELEGFFGHEVFDAQGAVYENDQENSPKLDQKADFCLDKKLKFVNGLIKK